MIDFEDQDESNVEYTSVTCPFDVSPADIIALCPHEPRTEWFDTNKKIVVSLVASPDEKVVVDYVAVCEECCLKGIDKIELTIGQRIPSGSA